MKHFAGFSIAFAVSLLTSVPLEAQARQATATMRVSATVVRSCQIAAETDSVTLSCAGTTGLKPRLTAQDDLGPATISRTKDGRFVLISDAEVLDAPKHGPADSKHRGRAVRVTVSF